MCCCRPQSEHVSLLSHQTVDSYWNVSSALMNYKPVTYFFPSACGNCSLTWQRDWVRTGTWVWLMGKCVEMGAVPWRWVTTPWSHTWTWHPRMKRTLMSVLKAKQMCRSFLEEQVADSDPAGQGRHRWVPPTQREWGQATHTPLSSPVTAASVRQEPSTEANGTSLMLNWCE